jgi:prefoldin subunit 4
MKKPIVLLETSFHQIVCFTDRDLYKMSATKDVEVHVEYADQQNINKFARQNAKLTELKEEIEVKRKELTSLSDAREALDELAILSDVPTAPLLVGETFLIEPTDDILSSLDVRKSKIEKEIDDIQQRIQTIQNVLSDLKVKLYGKFGKSINLENDEE